MIFKILQPYIAPLLFSCALHPILWFAPVSASEELLNFLSAEAGCRIPKPGPQGAPGPQGPAGSSSIAFHPLLYAFNSMELNLDLDPGDYIPFSNTGPVSDPTIIDQTAVDTFTIFEPGNYYIYFSSVVRSLDDVPASFAGVAIEVDGVNTNLISQITIGNRPLEVQDIITVTSTPITIRISVITNRLRLFAGNTAAITIIQLTAP